MIMAHYAKHITTLLLIALSLTLQIESRESKFFSKITHDKDKTSDIVMEAPLLAPAPAPDTKSSVSEESYGLYGHVPDSQLNSVKTGKFSQSYNQEQTRNPYYNKDVYHDNKYENGGYETKGYKSVDYNNNGYHGYKNENEGYVNGKLGMSDMRFSENGKYYNNVENVNNYDNGYGAERGINGESEGYFGYNENEFDTMEEYEKQQGYSDIQGEYFNP